MERKREKEDERVSTLYQEATLERRRERETSSGIVIERQRGREGVIVSFF